MSIESYRSLDNSVISFKPDPCSTYCVCKGALLGQDNTIILDVGESESGTFLAKNVGMKIGEETTLMKMTIL